MATVTKKKTDAEKIAAEKKTQARKQANVAANEAKHQANLDYIKEHGLSGFTIEKTITVRSKIKNVVVEKQKTVTRPAAPNTIVARHRNSLDNSRHEAWLEAQKGSPLEPSASTAQHIRAKAEAARLKSLQIVMPGA